MSLEILVENSSNLLETINGVGYYAVNAALFAVAPLTVIVGSVLSDIYEPEINRFVSKLEFWKKKDYESQGRRPRFRF